MLVDGHVEEKRKQTTCSMIPKTGDLTNPGNWRPLALVSITYKNFTRMVYKRVKPILELSNPKTKSDFVLLLVWMMLSHSLKMCVRNLWNGGSRCGVQILICGKLVIVLNTMLKGQGDPYAYFKFTASSCHDQVDTRTTISNQTRCETRRWSKPIVIQCWPRTCDEKMQVSYSTLLTSLWS